MICSQPKEIFAQLFSIPSPRPFGDVGRRRVFIHIGQRERPGIDLRVTGQISPRLEGVELAADSIDIGGTDSILGPAHSLERWQYRLSGSPKTRDIIDGYLVNLTLPAANTPVSDVERKSRWWPPSG